MSISREDVLRIARLAELELAEDEIEGMVDDLNAILDYAERVRAEDALAVEPTDATQPPDSPDPPTPLREDRAEPWPDPERALDEAPDRRGDLFRVPPALGG
jgi:aspartyl-tRNA(Asn)/glutamyl-tRNA(Gln) amidotransferase subunit C